MIDLGHGNAHVLPDSRLKNRDFGAVMSDIDLPDGSIIRLEMIPVFCANCGKHHGYVPKENITWSFWLCQPCADKCGEIAGMMMVPDHQYWEAVKEEMIANYGRVLTHEEVETLVEHGYGKLASIAKESPITV